MNGKFFINPGSATGAYSATAAETVPSFLLMDIQGDHVSCYLYRLVDGEVRVDKSDFTRQASQ
jgi:vacuolar protein sorting-associated protein 29